MVMKWCTKFWSSIEEVPFCFARSSIKFQGHTGPKIVDFDPNWEFSGGLLHEFELTDGYEMMHKAWSGIEEVPYFFKIIL